MKHLRLIIEKRANPELPPEHIKEIKTHLRNGLIPSHFAHQYNMSPKQMSTYIHNNRSKYGFPTPQTLLDKVQPHKEKIRDMYHNGHSYDEIAGAVNMKPVSIERVIQTKHKELGINLRPHGGVRKQVATIATKYTPHLDTIKQMGRNPSDEFLSKTGTTLKQYRSFITVYNKRHQLGVRGKGAPVIPSHHIDYGKQFLDYTKDVHIGPGRKIAVPVGAADVAKIINDKFGTSYGKHHVYKQIIQPTRGKVKSIKGKKIYRNPLPGTEQQTTTSKEPSNFNPFRGLVSNKEGSGK